MLGFDEYVWDGAACSRMELEMRVRGSGERLGPAAEVRVSTMWVLTSQGVDKITQRGGLRAPAFRGGEYMEKQLDVVLQKWRCLEKRPER